MRRIVTVLGGLALVIGLAGCASPQSPEQAAEQADEQPANQPVAADGHDHGHASDVVDGAREIAVTARSFAFEPDEIRVKAGEDVTIVLTSTDAEHDFTVLGTEVHVGAEAGQTAKGGLRIDQPGTYRIVCTVPGHEAAGMRATLVVEEA